MRAHVSTRIVKVDLLSFQHFERHYKNIILVGICLDIWHSFLPNICINIPTSPIDEIVLFLVRSRLFVASSSWRCPEIIRLTWFHLFGFSDDRCLQYPYCVLWIRFWFSRYFRISQLMIFSKILLIADSSINWTVVRRLRLWVFLWYWLQFLQVLLWLERPQVRTD